MAVVQIGYVRMRMRLGFVSMPVLVFDPLASGSVCMFMVVMTIVVAMSMDVLHRLMLVLMLVLVVQDQPQRYDKECKRSPL